MKGDKPYSWARKVGIEKGLFQYYWQKARIPTYDNLMKIQNYTGCSLDWLLAGKAVAFDQMDGLIFVKESSPVYGKQNLKRAESLDKVRAVYASRKESDIELLESILDRIAPASAKKSAPAKKAPKKKA
jgi:transcriptional regulator with XRE-family HTH domain